MNIPLLDLQAQYRSIKPEIDSAIHTILDNSQYILGKAVADFEKEFASDHKAAQCVAVGSGTDALHASLWALGIGPGDEVITVPFTFIATVESISLMGAKPVFVDIDDKTYTLDPKKLKAALTPRTKAVIPVHLYGQTADMDPIAAFCREHKLFLVEDAAQAHLAAYAGKPVGSWGNATCFSFYPGKNLGAYGEAGAILTNDEPLAKKMRQLRDHGQAVKYQHEFWGHNYRMDGFQGAVLGVKLRHLRQWTEARRKVADFYRKELKEVGDLVLPIERQGSYHVYHQFVLQTQHRDNLQKYLTEQGVATGLHYPIALHMQPAYLHLGYGKGDFPASEQLATRCISLPVYPELTNEQLSYIVGAVKKFFQQ